MMIYFFNDSQGCMSSWKRKGDVSRCSSDVTVHLHTLTALCSLKLRIRYMIQRSQRNSSLIAQRFCPRFKCESPAVILRDVVPDSLPLKGGVCEHTV